MIWYLKYGGIITLKRLKQFFVSDCELRQYKPPQKRGEGCERLTIFMQSRVPLGPGKFQVVVLVCNKFESRVRIRKVTPFSTTPFTDVT